MAHHRQALHARRSSSHAFWARRSSRQRRCSMTWLISRRVLANSCANGGTALPRCAEVGWYAEGLAHGPRSAPCAQLSATYWLVRARHMQRTSCQAARAHSRSQVRAHVLMLSLNSQVVDQGPAHAPRTERRRQRMRQGGWAWRSCPRCWRCRWQCVES